MVVVLPTPPFLVGHRDHSRKWPRRGLGMVPGMTFARRPPAAFGRGTSAGCGLRARLALPVFVLLVVHHTFGSRGLFHVKHSEPHGWMAARHRSRAGSSGSITRPSSTGPGESASDLPFSAMTFTAARAGARAGRQRAGNARRESGARPGTARCPGSPAPVRKRLRSPPLGPDPPGRRSSAGNVDVRNRLGKILCHCGARKDYDASVHSVSRLQLRSRQRRSVSREKPTCTNRKSASRFQAGSGRRARPRHRDAGPHDSGPLGRALKCPGFASTSSALSARSCGHRLGARLHARRGTGPLRKPQP